MRAWLLCFSVFLCSVSSAAYRVYRLRVLHYDHAAKLKRVEEVLTALDHLQYEHHNGGYRWDRVEYVDSWYCPGDTSYYRRFCTRPKDPVRGPASLDHPKRFPLNRQPVIP